MEISTTTSHATSEAKVTSHYWGYRELTDCEISAVSGGDGSGDGSDGGDAGGDGGGDGGSYGGGGDSGNNATGDNGVSCTRAGVEAYAACQQNNAELTVGIVQNMFSRWGTFDAGVVAVAGWCHDNRDSGGR